jgi:hypothetical protein
MAPMTSSRNKWDAGNILRVQSLSDSCPTPGKLRFERKAEAKRKAKRHGLTVYRCKCGYFHTTSCRRRKEQLRRES